MAEIKQKIIKFLFTKISFAWLIILIIFIFSLFYIYNSNKQVVIYNENYLVGKKNVSKQQNKKNKVSVKTRKYTFIFGGDVMLARHVQKLQEKFGEYTVAWESIADDFKQADLAIINLESPFSDKSPYPTEGFIFKAKPENIKGLKYAGIDVALLANNHFGNGGIYGMNYTFDFLDNNNIIYVGAGTSTISAYQGKIIDLSGLKIGLVNQSYDVPWMRVGNNKSGIAILNTEKLKNSILDLKSQGADLIIANFHGGIEYTRFANSDQKKFAHAAIDAGADLVVGHHPHWIQEMEIYKNKYIFYSLGNLIFDQDWSKETSEGLVLKVILANKKIKVFELKPVIIEDNFRPRFAVGEEIKNILDKINIPNKIDLVKSD